MGSTYLMDTRDIRCTKFSSANLQQRDHLGDLGINKRTKLK